MKWKVFFAPHKERDWKRRGKVSTTTCFGSLLSSSLAPHWTLNDSSPLNSLVSQRWCSMCFHVKFLLLKTPRLSLAKLFSNFFPSLPFITSSPFLFRAKILARNFYFFGKTTTVLSVGGAREEWWNARKSWACLTFTAFTLNYHTKDETRFSHVSFELECWNRFSHQKNKLNENTEF